jgi:hypothetical protein
MTATLRCRTLFDITVTGVRNHTSNSRLPFNDLAGQAVATDHDWVRSRNQQRNWETLNQILALRTLPENTTVPGHTDTDQGREWRFEFEIPSISSISEGDRPLGLLLQDCEAVPMITGLTETAPLIPELRTRQPDVNIWFELVD